MATPERARSRAVWCIGGSAIPEIDGHYFYSDYCGGYLRSFRYEDGAVTDATDWT